jgi:hypothetical protein
MPTLASKQFPFHSTVIADSVPMTDQCHLKNSTRRPVSRPTGMRGILHSFAAKSGSSNLLCARQKKNAAQISGPTLITFQITRLLKMP